MGTFSGLPGITEKIPLKISSRLLIQCLIVFHFDRFSCCDGELTGNFIAKSFRPQEIKNFLTLWAANISIFSPTTSFGRFGGEGFRSRRFQIETLYRKKDLIKNHNL